MGTSRATGDVSLPLLFSVPHEQHFDCRGCTRCCRELVVHLTAEDVRRIDTGGWASRLGVAPYVRLRDAPVLNHRDGACVFLTPDGRCRIHAEQGADEKPLACRMYPFTLEGESDVARASIRFDCPTVARNGGEPAARHREDVRRLAASAVSAGLVKPGPAAWRLCGSTSVNAGAMDRIAAALERWAGRRGMTVGQRLTGLLSWAETMSRAKLDRLDEQQIVELAEMLATDMEASRSGSADSEDKAGALSSAPPKSHMAAGGPGGNDAGVATKRQRSLFMQAVYSHCEHVSAAEARLGYFSALGRRWRQLRDAMRMTSATGEVPSLAGFAGRASFEQVDAVAVAAVAADAACQALLARYLLARLSGRTAFGPGYFGWPVVDGVRSLALAFAVIGWLTRYSAAAGGRVEATFEDVAAAVSAVDRNAGRAKELGAKSAALRLRYLGENTGIERLLTQYRVWGA